MTTRLTVLPFLLAMFIAVENMPLDIFQINAWNIGTAKTEPWRAKLTRFAGLVRRPLARIRAWFGAMGDITGLPALAAALVLMALVAHVHSHSHAPLMLGIVGLKDARQRVADLKADKLAKSKARATIGEKAITEKRNMTDEERAKFVALGAEIDAVDAAAKDAEDILAAAVAANELERTVPAVADPDAAAQAAAAARGGVQPRVELVDRTKAKGFFGRYLQAVKASALATRAGETLANAEVDVLRAAAGPTGLNTDIPSEGGFLVYPERSNVIIQRAYDTGAILSLVTKMPIGANSNGMKLPAIDETSRADNSRFGGIVSGWLGQGLTLGSGKPKFREMDMKLRKVGAFCYATDEQLADATALEAWINRYLPLELTFRTEDAILNGDGSNKPQGYFNSGAVIAATRNTTGKITYPDVSTMWSRMWAPLRKNAVWVIDQSCEQQLEQLGIPIGTAGVLAPVYKPAGVTFGPDGTQGYSPATLYGRPILTVEYCAALGTQGDISLVSFEEYIVIDKGGVDQAVSLHVAFLTDEAVYRFMYRVDGQCSWHTTLTPKNGGSTLSPIVQLAA